METTGYRICVTGPDYIGVTTLLRHLEHAGYHVRELAPKPPAEQRMEFVQGHFDALVQAWEGLAPDPRSVLFEDGPWGYFTRHFPRMPPAVRQACRHTLAQLVMPSFHVVLHTTGITVGRRHPVLHATPEVWSPCALSQMHALMHLQSPVFEVEASGPAHIVGVRVRRLLASKVFRVAELEDPTTTEQEQWDEE